MSRIALAWTLAPMLLLPPAGIAATDEPQTLRLARPQGTADESQTLLLDLEPAALRDLWSARNGRIEAFPLPGRRAVDLDLRAFELIAPGARFVVVDAEGPREVAPPPMRFFRGSVAGDPESLVSLSLFDRRIAGFIRAFGEEFQVAPRSFDLARDGALEVGVQNRAATGSIEREPFCPTEPLVPARPRASRAAPRGVDAGTGLIAHIAADATVEWYQHFGSLPAAQTYILNLLGQVSTLYDAEILVQIDVPYLRVFTAEPDPYTDGSLDTFELLGELEAEWNANQSGVSRSLAHLFSIRPSGGSGLAYLDVLCGNQTSPGNSFDYGVSTIPGNGDAFEKDLVAHEIGHGFSSPHTHCYVPEIDQCANEPGCYQGPTVQSVGTIMSYCNTTTSTFGPRVRNERLRPAAEAAAGLCIDVAGLPGDVRAETGDALRLAVPAACPSSSLTNDDGSLNSYFGAFGTGQLAWVKRFTPGCYPFRLERVDVLTGSSSVAVGRPMRMLVFAEPAGSGSPVDAVLVHTQDVAIQTVSTTVFNQYLLTAPVTVTSGDLYLGFYDLSADAPNTFIATVDTSRSGDSWSTINSVDPAGLAAYAPGTWMIRGAGGPVAAGSVLLTWGASCNDGTVPGQDFAVYRGGIGNFTSHQPLACTTGRNPSYLAQGAPNGSYFLVVPRTNAAEGSYGRASTRAERPPSSAACVVQDVATCP